MTMKHKTVKKLVGIAAAALLFTILYLNPFQLFEHRLQDITFQRYGLPHHDIFIIGIDDTTLEELGRFEHWSRQGVAEAVKLLNFDPYLRPAVIAIDILFTEPGLIPEFDRQLEEAVAGTNNIVMASLFNIGPDRETLSLPV